MDYEKFINGVRRRAGPISRDEAEAVVRAYLETLSERLSGERTCELASHLPGELAACLEGGGGGEGFSVWEFYERLSQKAGLAPEHATRYARHVGNVLGDVVPEKELEAVREELPPNTGSCRSACSRTPTTTGRLSAGPTTLGTIRRAGVERGLASRVAGPRGYMPRERGPICGGAGALPA